MNVTNDRTYSIVVGLLICFHVRQNCGARVLSSSHPHGNTRINTRLSGGQRISRALPVASQRGTAPIARLLWCIYNAQFCTLLSLSAVELSGDALAAKLCLSAIACFEMTSCCFFCFSTPKRVAQIYVHHIAPLSDTRVVAPNISHRLEVVVPLVQNICPSFYQTKSQVSPYKTVHAISIPPPQQSSSSRQHIPPYTNVDTSLCFRNDPDNTNPPRPSFQHQLHSKPIALHLLYTNVISDRPCPHPLHLVRGKSHHAQKNGSMKKMMTNSFRVTLICSPRRRGCREYFLRVMENWSMVMYTRQQQKVFKNLGQETCISI